MFPILETQEFETHFFLARTSLNTHGSEGKLFCSTSCNPTPLAISLQYNRLEHCTFVDACRYICTSLNLEENIIFSWEFYLICGTEEQREAGTEALLTHLFTITFPVLLFSQYLHRYHFFRKACTFSEMAWRWRPENGSIIITVCMGY